MSSSLLALATLASTASAAFQGFNYGATFTNGALKVQSDFENEFRLAASLAGTNGDFTSARLYTMIQGGTPNEPIQAIPAAIATNTSLLLGLWASAGQDAFNNEVAALRNTITQYCDQLEGRVAGISVGSEDLYRISPTAIANGEYAGASPDVLVSYIGQVRDAIRDTCFSAVPIGHVDTWTAYVNGSNAAVIEALDWLGMDAYPYFENTKPNALSDGLNLFLSALDQTRAAAQGKEVWITETGWPVSGDTENLAVPSTDNAREYWRQVGCALFGQTNTWWYTLDDSAPDTPNPSFGVIDESSAPLYDLSCDNVEVQPLASDTATRSVNDTSGVPTLGPAPGPINGTSGPAPGPVNGTSGGAGGADVPAANGSTTSPPGSAGTGAGTVPGIAGGSHLDSAAVAVMALVLALALL